MKKKTLLILMVFCSLILFGCGKKEEEKVFTFKFQGVDITPGKKFDKDKMESMPEESEVPDCALGGTGYMYTFNELEISTSEDQTIYSVYFIDPGLETTEGISKGASIEDVKKAYGTPTREEKDEYIYKRGNVELSFVFHNDSVSIIEYTLGRE